MSEKNGLLGKTIKLVRPKGLCFAHPWSDTEVEVLIIDEQPEFLVGLVLPHRNPEGVGESYRYKICVNKYEIEIGEIIVNGGKRDE